MIPEIAALKKQVKKLPNVIESFVQNAFDEFDSVAEDFNIDQLLEGKRSDGSSLPDYSINSVTVFGKPPGAMTLKDTGAFHKSITLNAGKNEADIDATDPKTDMLVDNYGEKIIGLSEQHLNEYRDDFIKPSVQEDINKFFNVNA